MSVGIDFGKHAGMKHTYIAKKPISMIRQYEKSDRDRGKPPRSQKQEVRNGKERHSLLTIPHTPFSLGYLPLPKQL